MSQEDKPPKNSTDITAHYIGAVHTGSGDIKNYGLERYDVESCQKYDGSIYRETIKDLQDPKHPILIGRGTRTNPTIIMGSMAGYFVKTEDYILVYGSICGLRNVDLGKDNYIQGSLIGDEVKADQGLWVHESIFARNLTLQTGANIKGHILCEKILDSNGQTAPVLPVMKVAGTLVCSQSIEIPETCQIGAVISTGDVHLSKHCSINAIIAKGDVFLPEQSFVSHVQCGRLYTDKNVKISFACVEDCIDLGEGTDIGFLYCENGIGNIGDRVRLWNSSLISRHRQPIIQNHFWLNKQEYSMNNALGLMPNGQITSILQSTTGTIYTNLLNEKLLLTIGSLAPKKLHI